MADGDKPSSLTGKLYSSDNNNYYIRITQGKFQGTPFGFVSVAIVRISDGKDLFLYTRRTEGEPFDNLEFVFRQQMEAEQPEQPMQDMKSYNIYAMVFM